MEINTYKKSDGTLVVKKELETANSWRSAKFRQEHEYLKKKTICIPRNCDHTEVTPQGLCTKCLNEDKFKKLIKGKTVQEVADIKVSDGGYYMLWKNPTKSNVIDQTECVRVTYSKSFISNLAKLQKLQDEDD